MPPDNAFEASIFAFGRAAQSMGGRMALLKATELLRQHGQQAASDLLMQHVEKLTQQEEA